MSSLRDVPDSVARASADPAPAWLARLPEQNPDVVLRLAEDGRVLYMNPSARAMFAGELAVGSLAPAALLPAVSQALVSGAAQEAELERGDRWLSVRTTADGHEANIYARDITERKQTEQALRQSERKTSRLNGHEVAIASDGSEGLRRARELRPDFVLCDIGLPGMDGYAVARAFRADDFLKSVQLVALSGYALPEDLERAAEAGFDGHLAKPPSLDKLQDLLGRLAGKG